MHPDSQSRTRTKQTTKHEPRHPDRHTRNTKNKKANVIPEKQAETSWDTALFAGSPSTLPKPSARGNNQSQAKRKQHSPPLEPTDRGLRQATT